MSSTVSVFCRVNGAHVQATVPARLTLVEWLRDYLGLTGTHVGCEHGVCGACTVLMDDRSVRACLSLAVQADGCEITTVEGLSPRDGLSPLQACFRKHHALQCGFCTPGILTTAHALLQENPQPTRSQIEDAISGNLCRCTGYISIVDAIQEASRGGCSAVAAAEGHATGHEAAPATTAVGAAGSTASGPLTPVGRAVERVEDERLLRGQGTYVDDMKLEGMLHAVIVRSQVAHGRVRGIDTEAARSVEGVSAVLVHDDIAPFNRPIPIRVGPLEGLEQFLQTPLANEFVRYVGEPLAVVIASDRAVAEDAADLVWADIEPLEPVVSLDDALAGRHFAHEAASSNVASRYVVGRGDAEAAFTRARYVRKERLKVQRHSSVPLETRGLLAHYDVEGGRLQVWGATKVPFYNRKLLAAMLDMAESAVDLIEVDVGGSFGARGEFYPEDLIIPLAAKLLGRPVKWIEDRRENLIAMNHSRDVECEVEIAADTDGTIHGLRATLWADMGAYARTTGGIVPAKAASFLPGPYDVAHYECRVHALMTNKTPAGTFRGPGRFEANFFRERIIDMMAADLGLDPMQVRRRNLIPPERMPYDMGALVPYESESSAYDTGDYPAAFEYALEKIGYASVKEMQGREIDGRWHGIGAACFVDSSGSGPAEYVRLAVESPSRLCLYTGTASSGQGHETSLAQIFSQELGLPMDIIRVFHGSTTGLARGVGTYHGRGLVMGGSAVKRLAERWIARLLDEASRRGHGPVAEMAYRSGAVYRQGGAVPVMTLEQLCDAALEGDQAAAHVLQAEAEFAQSKLTFEYGTQIAHVAVDPETATVEVVRMITVEDCGNVVNPLIVHGQVVGASVQGLGGALLEEFVYDESGQMLSGTLADYLMPTSTDFRDVLAYSVNLAPSRLNPLGAKGVGEGGIEGVGAAVANAVSNALRPLGVEIRSLPISPNKLFGALEAHRLSTSPG